MAETLDTYIKSPSPPKDADAQYVYNEQQFSSLEKSLKKHHDKILDVSATAQALYENEVSARATADSAIVKTVENLTAKVDLNDTNTQASIHNLQTAQVDSESATATKITELEAKVDAADASNLAKINEEAKTRATKVDSLASKVSSLEASVKTTNSNLLSTIKNEQIVRATADQTEAIARTDLSSYVGFKGQTYGATVTEMLGTKAAADGVSYNWTVQGKVGQDSAGNAAIALTGVQKFNADGTTSAYSKLLINANTEIQGNLLVSGSITGSKIATGSTGVGTDNIVANAITGIAAGSSASGVASATITGVGGATLLIVGSIDGTYSTNSSLVDLRISVVAGSGIQRGYYNSKAATLYGITPVALFNGYVSSYAGGFQASGPYTMWGFGGNGTIIPRSFQVSEIVQAADNNVTLSIFCGVFVSNTTTQIPIPTSVRVWQFKK